MTTKPLVVVSVILTTYNSEKTLQRTLDSIFSQEGLNQDFSIELLVIDDCSTDATRAILGKNDIRFIGLEKNSGGPNKGRNIGLDRATGEYICIMDHDDEWFPHRLRSLLSAREIAPVISSGYTLVHESSHKKIERKNRSTDATGIRYYGRNVTFLQTLSRSAGGQLCYLGSVLFHRSLNVYRFEENFGKMDYDWGLKLLQENPSAEICSSLYNRYVDDTNLSLNGEYRSQDFFFSLMVLDQYEERYPKEAKMGCKRMHGSRARFFFLTGNMKKARHHFLRAEKSVKNLLYYITTFAGARMVKKRFTVFG